MITWDRNPLEETIGSEVPRVIRFGFRDPESEMRARFVQLFRLIQSPLFRITVYPRLTYGGWSITAEQSNAPIYGAFSGRKSSYAFLSEWQSNDWMMAAEAMQGLRASLDNRQEDTEREVFRTDTDQARSAEMLARMLHTISVPTQREEVALGFDPDDYPVR